MPDLAEIHLSDLAASLGWIFAATSWVSTLALSSVSRFSVGGMRIGELGRRAGVSPRTLRHYEDLGLLPAHRRANGYREYDDHDLALVAEIRSLVGLGFALEETRPFVECLRSGHPTGSSCPDALAVHRQKLAEVDDGLRRLHAVRDELAAQLTAVAALRAGVPTAEPPLCQFRSVPREQS